MKHHILLFSFCLITSIAIGQSNTRVSSTQQKVQLSVYPNPTTDFIKVSDNSEVEQVILYNLAGRQVKSFNYIEDQKYYVGDLPRGMYLVQLVNSKRNTLATRRVSVR